MVEQGVAAPQRTDRELPFLLAEEVRLGQEPDAREHLALDQHQRAGDEAPPRHLLVLAVVLLAVADVRLAAPEADEPAGAPDHARVRPVEDLAAHDAAARMLLGQLDGAGEEAGL